MLHRCIAIKPVIPVHSLNELSLFLFICQQGRPGASRADWFSIFMYIYFRMIPIIQKNKCHKESFFSLFPNVMILFSSSRSASANNWVTLMGHDMYKAWHVGMLRYWCCSERKASSSYCFVSHSFIYFSTLVASCTNPPHLALCPLSIRLHLSINTRSDGGLFSSVWGVVEGDKEIPLSHIF